jgi:acetyl esterase/lipase
VASAITDPSAPPLVVHPADSAFPGPRPAVLVLPGGGYREHTEHDGDAYARWLSRLGVHAFVLHYRLRPHPFPAPLQDARAGLDRIRSGEHGLAVAPGRVGVIGSSAGGHLAGLLLAGTVLSIEDPPLRPPRPDFAVLAYAVADLALLPGEAVAALLGDLGHLADELSPARHLRGTICPAFVWATAQDGPGLPHALAWTRALADAGARVELHVYPDGGHGVGLADGVRHGGHGGVRLPHTAHWTSDCERWLRAEGLL